MIGPHQDIELKLMLAGHKAVALFGDTIPESGIIPEEIIPDKAFSPYVTQGLFLRFSEDITDVKKGFTIRYVCFSQPDQAWRAHSILWLKRNIRAGIFPDDSCCDKMIGRMLGYEEQDIQEFIDQF